MLPFVTKVIVPQRKSAILSRPRLLGFLHEYLDRKLILISAAAGYGKTTLLLDFAHDTELPVCWYSLDKGDRDPQIFLAYLLGSLQRQFPHFGSRTQTLLQDANSALIPDQIVGTLVTEIHDQIASYFVLVLDDYQFIDSSAATNHILDNLLSFLPDNAHIVLAGRTVPTQLTLTRLASQMQIAGLGSNDLRFTGNEIRDLLKQNYTLDITESVAEQLADQSEGWIASIVLTTPTLWQGLFHDWVKTRGAGSQLFDYLATEVFAQQPEPLQTFLQETSILDQMNASLCNELLEITDARTHLNSIEERNLFISRLEEDWYRYHHLFQEFLQSVLSNSHPERFRELLERAAALFERHGLLNQAIEYWLKAEQFEEAARVIEMCIAEVFKQGGWATAGRWIDALPEQMLRERPELILWRGRIHSQLGELADAVQVLGKARAEFEERGDQRSLARVLNEEAIVARFQGRYGECLQKSRAALAQLEGRETSLIAQAHRAIGASLAALGDVGGSITELESALELFQLANDDYATGLVENDLAAAHTLLGNRAEAAPHFEHALGYWRSLANPGYIANTLNSMGVGYYYAGEFDQAQVVLKDALEEARRAGYMRIEGYILAGLGDVYRAIGNLEQALNSDTEAFQIAEKIREASLLTCTLSGLSHSWRLAGDLKLAEQLSQNAIEAARAHRSDYELALAGIALGAVRVEQEKFGEAYTWLEHALELLKQHSAERDIRRVQYFLGLAYFRQKQPARAARCLKDLAATGDSTQDNGWLLSEGTRALPLIQFALKRHIEDKYFRMILKNLKQVAQKPQSVLQVIEPTWPSLEIKTLGSTDVMREGRVIQRSEWQTEATKELFLFFVLHPHPWRKEQILSILWPEKSAAHANDMFHSSIYRIRRALFPEVLLYRDGKYQLNLEAEYRVDVNEFERLLKEADSAEGGAAVEILPRALDLYKGDLLEEFYSEWANKRRELVREKYIAALLRLAEHERSAGHFDQAVGLYNAALEKDNQQETAYRALMTLFWERGERTHALQIYEQCSRTLSDELGVAPTPETISLYEAIVKSR